VISACFGKHASHVLLAKNTGDATVAITVLITDKTIELYYTTLVKTIIFPDI